MSKTVIVKTLSDEDVHRILSIQENWVIDMKGKSIAPAKLSRTISAFANNSGGEIYLGISMANDKSFYWDGFSCIEDANAHIAILDSIMGGFDNYDIIAYNSSANTTLVLHITIQKTNKVIYASNNIPYKRVNAFNQPCDTTDKKRRLELDKGISSFEDEFTQYKFDEIKSSNVLNNFVSQVVPSSTSYDWLRSQYVMNAETKISVAGVLLYAETPQAILPKRSAIRILRYHTDEKEGTRGSLDPASPESIEGDIYSLINEAVKKVVSIVEAVDVVGMDKIESKKYPIIALHKIITNAVLHRDYSILGDIQIRIFTDRIEIESPGRLAGHITVENILTEQVSRNAKIVRLISKFPKPPNKDAGEGLNTAFAAMANMRLQKSIIKETEHSVLVIVSRTHWQSPA